MTLDDTCRFGQITGQDTDIAIRADISVGHLEIAHDRILSHITEQTIVTACKRVDVHILHFVEIAIIGTTEPVLYRRRIVGMSVLGSNRRPRSRRRIFPFGKRCIECNIRCLLDILIKERHTHATE